MICDIRHEFINYLRIKDNYSKDFKKQIQNNI